MKRIISLVLILIATGICLFASEKKAYVILSIDGGEFHECPVDF